MIKLTGWEAMPYNKWIYLIHLSIYQTESISLINMVLMPVQKLIIFQHGVENIQMLSSIKQLLLNRNYNFGG